MDEESVTSVGLTTSKAPRMEVTTMPELKPCPFCGGNAAVYVDVGVKVICQNCHIQTEPLKDMISACGVWGNATKSVVDAWNGRVNDA